MCKQLAELTGADVSVTMKPRDPDSRNGQFNMIDSDRQCSPRNLSEANDANKYSL